MLQKLEELSMRRGGSMEVLCFNMHPLSLFTHFPTIYLYLLYFFTFIMTSEKLKKLVIMQLKKVHKKSTLLIKCISKYLVRQQKRSLINMLYNHSKLTFMQHSLNFLIGHYVALKTSSLYLGVWSRIFYLD